MVRVSIDQLADEIAKTLTEYTEDVEKGIEKAQKSVTRKAVSQLKSTSPRKKGKYAAGWASKATPDGRVVYNKSRHQLTHLLEKGHALRQGGRVRAIPHIRPVEQMAIEEYIKAVEDVIRNG